MFAEPQQKNGSQLQSPQSQSPHIQPKLEVGAKDDPQEKEADAVADSVMRMSENSGAAGDTTAIKTQQESPMARLLRRHPDAPRPQIIHRLADAPKAPSIQRAPAAIQGPASPALRKKEDEENAIAKAPAPGAVLRMHDAEEETVQKKEDEENVMMKEDEENVMMKEDEENVMKMDDGGKGGTAPAAVEQGIQSSKGQGSPLPENVQQDIGGKMGADLSDVRVHTGSDAHEMSTAINAKAFTHGQDVYFKNGNYDTSSSSGKKLLTHELTHTQQQKAPGVQRKVQRGFWGDLYDMTIGGAIETITDYYHYFADSPEEYHKYIQDKLINELNYWNSNPEPTLGFKIAYYGSMGVASMLFPLSIAIFPPMEALWALVVRGKQGYYEYLYHLDPGVPEKEEGALNPKGAASASGTRSGKAMSSLTSGVRGSTSTPAAGKAPSSAAMSPTAANTGGESDSMSMAPEHVPQKKLAGGYAAVVDHQMKNLADPMFLWGEIKGIFKGIGGWFVDIWDSIVWLVEGIGSLVSGTYNWVVEGETPDWITSLKEGATTAWEFLSTHGAEMLSGIQKAMQSPGGELTSAVGDMKQSMLDGAGDTAYEKGRGMAAQQVEIMTMSAEEQGEKVGYVIGYLIPEILLMIFSGSLGNWIKGALMAMSKFKAVMTAVRVWEKIVEVGRWTVSALRKMWKGIKSFFSSTFGKAFDEVLLFFDDFVKHGDDMAKIEKNTPTPAGVVDDVPHTGDRTPDVDGSGPRNDGPDGNKKHTPDADDTMRNLAYAEMVAEVRQSNMADEPMLKFQSDIYGIKRHFPIVKLFKFVSDGAGGSHVYMKASPLKYGGHKKKPTDVPNNVPGRSGAFRKAKRDAGIDLNQQPYKVDNVKMTDKYGNTIFDEKGEPIWTREYYYKNNKGQDIVIQDHSAGHSFGEGGLGDQGSHFNVRPAENTRTGTVPGTQDHYYFN